jgi:peptide-methionine (S)-S-oxide reductase
LHATPLRYTLGYGLVLVLLLAWLWMPAGGAGDDTTGGDPATMNDTPEPTGQARADGLHEAVFAGGCFWCMEPPYDKLDGVVETVSGYAGGHVENPSYGQVVDGGTGHAEVVKVVYDPGVVSYDRLLEVFWRNIDPTTLNRQFCDVGAQYRTAIFYLDDDQRRAAEASRERIEAGTDLPGAVVTAIEPLAAFYPAEDYHQDYYRKNPLRYRLYRSGCGRDARLRQLWGEQDD